MTDCRTGFSQFRLAVLSLGIVKVSMMFSVHIINKPHDQLLNYFNLVLIMTAEVAHSISYLLPAHLGHIQQVVCGQDDLQASIRGIVSVKYIVTVPEERTKSKVAIPRFPGYNLSLLLGLDPRSVCFRRAIKRKLPAHPIPIRSDFRQGCGSHGGKGSLPAPQMVEVGDMVHAE